MFHLLSQRDAGTILVLTRTGERFQSTDEVELERRRLRRELDAVGRAGKHLLIDSRAAPLSTDQQVGGAFGELRREIQRGFERIAVILQTKVGVLQANRLASNDLAAGSDVYGRICVFETEEEALKFLRGSADAAANSSRVSIWPTREQR
jgi:hypothetical protein